jgi:hypothetical protein
MHQNKNTNKHKNENKNNNKKKENNNNNTHLASASIECLMYVSATPKLVDAQRARTTVAKKLALSAVCNDAAVKPP